MDGTRPNMAPDLRVMRERRRASATDGARTEATRDDEAISAAGYGPGAPFARRGRLRGRDSSEENPGWAGKKSIDDGLKQGGDAHLTGSALSGASLLLTRGMIAPPQSFGARPGLVSSRDAR